MKSIDIIALQAVARSENPEGHIVLGGDNVLPLVDIGLTDLPKSGCAMAHPAHPGTTGLPLEGLYFELFMILFPKLQIGFVSIQTFILR